jgi:hypothetical protein
MTTHRSFQKILSNVSSLVSSSVTPPNRIPVLLAAHDAILQPERSDGANAVDGRFRLSHLIFKGTLFFDFDVVAIVLSSIVRLIEAHFRMRMKRREVHILQEPGVFKHHSNRSLSFGILLAVSTFGSVRRIL